MHRPGIAIVVADKVILDGTTIEEVKNYHRETLLLCVTEANTKYREHLEQREQAAARKADATRRHRDDVSEAAKDITFS